MPNPRTHRAPDVARVKSKMMYASTKDFFKGLLDGISGARQQFAVIATCKVVCTTASTPPFPSFPMFPVEFQASELDEVTEDEVAEAVRALKRS